MKQNKVKYTVTFPSKVDQRIEEISEKEDISKPETLRRAIALYSYVYDEINENGNKICVVDSESEKVIKEIVFQI